MGVQPKCASDVGGNWRYYQDGGDTVNPGIEVNCTSSPKPKWPPGCIIEENVDYPGYDIGSSTTVADQEACAERSSSTDGSLFWTYQPSTKSCWVKTSNAGKIAMQNIVSGNSLCVKAGKSKHRP